ncbi:hypothetical protein GCM10027062_20910 [Nocardioides hungaricus]
MHHHVPTIGDGERQARVLLHQQDPDVGALELFQQLADAAGDGRRESEGRLVEHQQPGRGDETTGDGDHLLLTAAQPSGTSRHQLADERQVRRHPFEVGLGGPALAIAAHLEVLLDRETWEELPSLGDVADAEAHDLAHGAVPDRVAVEKDAPLMRAVESGHSPQAGRLPHAVAAEQGDDLAGLDGERHFVQNLDRTAPDVD